MSTVTVSSVAGLTSALKTAQAGEVIQLAPGTYSGVTISGMNFSAPVTITSQSSTNQAVLTSLSVLNSSDLTITNLQMDASTAKADNPFYVYGSTNINLNHLNVHGSLDNNPQDDVALMLIRSSTNVSVTDSQFQQALDGIGHLNDTGLTISGNYIHDIRNDAIRGGGSSDVTISNNLITNFDPVAGDHDDAIQFWTTGTTADASNITVEGNVITRGTGSDDFQGIFFGNELSLPYQDVTVSNNTVSGAGYNGISVAMANNVTMAGNDVWEFSDQQSWIALVSNTNAVVEGNISSEIGYPKSTGITQASNQTVAAVAVNTSIPTWNPVTGAIGPSSIGAGSTVSSTTSTTTNAASTTTASTSTTVKAAVVATTATASTNSTTSSAANTAGTSSTATTTAAAVVSGLTLSGATSTSWSQIVSGGSTNGSLAASAAHALLVAGTGNETLTGGGGGDTFQFGITAGQDVISNFSGNDVLDLSGIFKYGFHSVLTDTSTGVTITFPATGGLHALTESITLLGVHSSQLEVIHGANNSWLGYALT